MTDMIFDGKNCRDLVRVPLKGEHLQEFISCLSEQLESQKEWLDALLKKRPPALREQASIVHELVKERLVAMTQVLLEKLAKVGETGIHLDELKLMIQVAGQMTQDIIDGSPLARSKPIRTEAMGTKIDEDDYQETLEQEFVKAIQQDFCQCLAVQQGREQDYYQMIGPHCGEAAKQLKSGIEKSDNPGAQTILGHVALNITQGRKLLQARKDRRSPLAAFMEAELTGNKDGKSFTPYGMQYTFRQCIEAVHKLNPIDNRADRVKLTELEAGYFKKAAEALGLDTDRAAAAAGM